MNDILIIYFSGTGGTKMAAEKLMEKLNEKNKQAGICTLDLSVVEKLEDVNKAVEGIKRLVLIYPVYSFDAPSPVYRWLRTLPKVQGTKASVISVTGGGDAKANKACRQLCIKAMTRKGFDVDHEDILTMPSNYFVNAGEDIDMLLMKALPIKMEKIAEDIVDGTGERRAMHFAPMSAIAAKLFKFGAMMFGLTLYADKSCTDCKLCQNSCPTGNIRIKNGRMKTSTKCAWCMRCTYICPQNAVKSLVLGGTILKEGFNIKKIEQKAEAADEKELMKKLESKSWADVVDYIKEIYKPAAE
ncbi:MAG: EFR1 family ferrodoxin [Eubacteriales bacterium]